MGGMMYGGTSSSLHQLLFGVQNVIFSLTQAVQIIGMNTEAVKSLLTHATTLIDHAVATWKEQAHHLLEQQQQRQNDAPESVDQRKRRRRLRAIRWALTTVGTYAAYKVLQWTVQWSIGTGRRRREQRVLS